MSWEGCAEAGRREGGEVPARSRPVSTGDAAAAVTGPLRDTPFVPPSRSLRSAVVPRPFCGLLMFLGCQLRPGRLPSFSELCISSAHWPCLGFYPHPCSRGYCWGLGRKNRTSLCGNLSSPFGKRGLDSHVTAGWDEITSETFYKVERC